MKPLLVDILDARKYVARINDYPTCELAAMALAREFWRVRTEVMNEAAAICEREQRACEHHMHTVQQIGHDGKHHKAAAQVAGDCAAMIRSLVSPLPPLVMQDDRTQEQLIADGDATDSGREER